MIDDDDIYLIDPGHEPQIEDPNPRAMQRNWNV